MFKKIVCIALSLVMVCGMLSGCGKKAEPESKTEQIDVSNVQAPKNEGFDTSIYGTTYDWENAKIDFPMEIDTANKNGLMSIYIDPDSLYLDIDSRMESGSGSICLYTSTSDDKLYSYLNNYDTGEESAVYVTGDTSKDNKFDPDAFNLTPKSFAFIKYLTSDLEYDTLYDVCEVAAPIAASSVPGDVKNIRFYAYINRDTQKLERIDNILDDVHDPNVVGITMKHVDEVPVPNWLQLCKEASDAEALTVFGSLLAPAIMLDDGSLGDTYKFNFSSDDSDFSSFDEDKPLTTFVIEYPKSDVHPDGHVFNFDSDYFEVNDIETDEDFITDMILPVDPTALALDVGGVEKLTGDEKFTAHIDKNGGITATWNWKDKKWDYTYEDPFEAKYHDEEYWNKKFKGYTAISMDRISNTITVTDADGNDHKFEWDEDKEDVVEVSE